MRYTKEMANLTLSGSHRERRTWDGLILLWVVFWIAMGAAVAVAIWTMSGLADSAVESGRALDSAGKVFEGLGQIPVIGEGPGQFGTEVRQTAENIVVNGEQAGRSIHGLSILLGVTVAVLPSIPVVGFYLPMRLALRRDTRQVRQALRQEGMSERLRDYLAGRATMVLSYDEVMAATRGVPGDDREERRHRLALAELRRLDVPFPSADRST